MKSKKTPSGIILYAKNSGLTSFSSLWSIKHAIGTEKVGHTGTLDSFAEGLLVVLSGSLTHLVSHITSFTKTYRAVICFGKTTDTLDPTGIVTEKGKSVSKEQVQSVLGKFTGTLLQVPPVYSAIHVDGKRSSELVREGKKVEMEVRQVFIYKNELIDFKEDEGSGLSYALVEITCSKGTYIRALARDIAQSLGTCAYLTALRRTKIGPFSLEDAACFSSLDEFTIEKCIEKEKIIALNKNEKKKDSDSSLIDIRSHFLTFTPELAALCGFESSTLREEWKNSYLNGRPLQGKMFSRMENLLPEKNEFCAEKEIAVFYESGKFAGIIQKRDGRLFYGFVVPPFKSEPAELPVFSWTQIQSRDFPLEWKKKGTALTVGKFDGIHIGHQALIDSVLQQNDFAKGVVTFSSSCKKSAGEVTTLKQKLKILKEKNLDFAVVIDFSDDFSKIKGEDFIDTLVDVCGMKFLAEGKDFNCGYKGESGGNLTMKELALLAGNKGFFLSEIQDVILEGKKVSSSRIRDAVKNGDFALVQKMLLRPFSYDCSEIKFTLSGCCEKDGMSWFEGECSSSQVLLSEGNYNVVAIMSGSENVSNEKNLNTLHTLCAVEGGKIKLLLPSENAARRVRTINFIPAKI